MFKFDHIVHFTSEQDTTTAIDLFSNYGHEVKAGGSHIDWGTRNHLLFANLSYVEFLQMENPMKAIISNNPLIKQFLHDANLGVGLGQICIRVREIEKHQKKFQSFGLNVSDIYPGKRTRVDGKTIQWKMLFINQEYNENLPYPFFIEWEEEDNLRIMDFIVNRILNPISLNREISSVWFTVKDIGAVAGNWSQLLESKIASFTNLEFSINGLEIQLQNTKLRFVSNDVLENSSKFSTGHFCERPFLVEFSNGNDVVKINGGYYRI